MKIAGKIWNKNDVLKNVQIEYLNEKQNETKKVYFAVVFKNGGHHYIIYMYVCTYVCLVTFHKICAQRDLQWFGNIVLGRHEVY